jgi:hypothetical protein
LDRIKPIQLNSFKNQYDNFRNKQKTKFKKTRKK